MAVAGPAAVAQFLLVGTAFLSLMYAYVVSDFTVANVVENSHSAKPMLYKVTGVWGNHEGSMVLWILMLAGFGAARSEEHTSELQSLMRISYAVFCLKKKKKKSEENTQKSRT